MPRQRQEGEQPVTTSISYPLSKLNYISERAAELEFRSRNDLIAGILDDWIKKDQKQSRK